MSVSFVGELYDQFLVCRLCSEPYRHPKTLLCMHTFCEACLEMHYDMEEKDRPYRFLSLAYNRALACPICRAKTELPAGGIHRLPDNFLVANLGEVINRRKATGSRRCEICTAVRSRGASKGRWPMTSPDGATDEDEDEGGAEDKHKATNKCLDCVKFLCAGCADLHRRTKVTQTHTLFDADVQKDIECKVHANEPLRFYCEQCEACVCVLCTFHTHRAHEVSTLQDGVARHRNALQRQLGVCGERVTRMRTQIELIERCELDIARAEAQIRDATIEAIAEVRRREKDLMAGIRDAIGDRALRFIAEKETLRENLLNVETTVQMTDAMLKGTSIELLMVKKEIGDKLKNVLAMKVEQTPEVLKKEGPFVADVNFGDAVVDWANSTRIGSHSADAAKRVDVAVTVKAVTREMEVQTHRVELKDVETVMDIDEKTKADETDAKRLHSSWTQTDAENLLTENGDDVRAVLDGNDETLHRSAEKEIALIAPVEYIVPVEYVTPLAKDSSASVAEPPLAPDPQLANPVTKEQQLQLKTEASVTTEVATCINFEAIKVNIPNSQPQSPTTSAPNPQTSTSAVPKSNLVQNWQNNCKRRSSIAKSFELTQLPSSTPFVTVKAMKGVFAGSENGNGASLTGDNGGIINTSPNPNGFGSRAPRLTHQPSLPLMKTTGTSMKQITYQDSSTSMPVVSFIDKECSTRYVIMKNNSVSTDNQGMVDKSTSTMVDVTSTYRNVTSSRRLITVSRGTCTPKAMFPFFPLNGAANATGVAPQVAAPDSLAGYPGGQGYCINMPNPSLPPRSRPVDTSAHLRLVVQMQQPQQQQQLLQQLQQQQQQQPQQQQQVLQQQQQTPGNVEEFFLETH